MPRSNYVFLHDKVAKKIFKSKVGKELTAKIVGELLDEDYHVILDNLIPVHEEIGLSSKLIDSKADVTYETDKILLNIEINYDYGPNRKAQEFSYICELFLKQIKHKDDYTTTKQVVQIVIENYDFFKANRFIYEMVLKEKTLNLEEDTVYKKYHISLEYLEKMGYTKIVNEGTKLQKMLTFLTYKDTNSMLNELYKGDDFMAEVIKEAKQIAGIEKLPLYLDDDRIRKLDQEYHFNNGVEKNKHEMIINLHNNKVPIEIIAKSAELSIEEVEKIIKEAKQIAGIEKLPLYLDDDRIRKLDQEYHFNNGFEQGVEQGIEKIKREMIINMHNDNVPISTISKYANLSIEEVERIINKS